MKNMLRRISMLACVAVLPVLAGAAQAAEALDVEVDQSRMLTIQATPGAVVIGNPSIADVSLHLDKVFVHGRTFGQTNLIILDQKGETLAQFNIMVKHTTDSALALYEGTQNGVKRKSYTCWPLCESDLQTGDDPDYNGAILSANMGKTKFATGEDTAEAKAPAAPQ